MMRAYGAEVVLSPPSEGMKGALALAEKLKNETPNSVIAGQFVNPSNVKAHELKTGPELVEQCKKYGINPKYFISGIGTGGTITGVSHVMKPLYPDMKVIAVEPEKSPLLSTGVAGPHGIQGIGPNFVPPILDREVIDKIVTISQEDAEVMCRRLPKEEALFVGISSAAAIKVAIDFAEEHGVDVLVVAPDGGEKYMSMTNIFKDEPVVPKATEATV